MKFRLFLSDFDGTLVRADGTVSDRTKRAIADYVGKGGIFAVCTGRMLPSILPRMRELGLQSGYVIAYQGAVIAEIATGKLVKSEGFLQEDAETAVKLLEADGRHIHVYTEEGLFCNRRDEMLEEYERICRVKAEIPEEKLSVWLMKKPRQVVKILTMTEPERCLSLVKELRERLGEKYFVTRSSDWLAEIMPAGQNKGGAVDFLCRRFGVSREDTAAIGDQLNDLPMLQAAGGKIAVANAAEELKEIARVVSSNEEDGVAEALKIAMGEKL